MRELVTPEQSEKLVLLLAALLLIGGALWGMRAIGRRGLLFGLIGPLLFGAWQSHKWLTRYDPQSGYFGLDKVWVLILEVVLFALAGALLGRTWRKLATDEHRLDTDVHG